MARFVRSHQTGFEMIGMELDDRVKLCRRLISLGTNINPDSPSAQ